jgi:PAS domain S-box-containing protein
MIENLQEHSSHEQARLRLLGELSAAFAEAGRTDEELLDLIARCTAEAIPEICLLRLMSRDGKRLKLASIYGPDPEAVAFFRKILMGASPLLENQPQAVQAIRTGETVVWSDLPPAYTERLVRPELWPLVERFGPKRSLSVQMRTRGRVIGVLTIGRSRPELPPFSAADQALAEAVAAWAAPAIENARLHRLLTTEQKTLETIISEKTSELEEVRWRLAEMTRLQRATVDNANYAVLTTRLDGTIITFNAAAESWLGYRSEEVANKVSAALLHDPQELEERARELASELGEPVAPGFDVLVTQARRGKAEVREWSYLGKDGTRFPVRLYVSPVRARGGRVSGFVCTANDLRSEKTEAALREARATAERANTAKSEFLSRMSHELRTPLNAIIGFSQLLGRRDLPESQREYVSYIEKSGSHLLDLINEVLDIARIEAGKMSVSLEPVDLGELLGEVISLIAPQAEKRQILLIQTVSSNGWVNADKQRLKQVLLNLCSNAVKFNREEGQMHVSVERLDSGRFRIAVEDTGPGIAPEERPRLFQPFERLSADQRGTEGSGLGLALSKHLVELMDGTIGCESEVGRGSTFWIDLPPAEPPEPKVPEAPEAGLDDGQSRRATVLYIEVNLSYYRLVEAIFKQRPQIQMIAAMQGQMGLELAREHRPDLILLDLDLPDLEGDEVLRRLKQIPETQDIPVVVLTADALRRKEEKVAWPEAAAHVTKPFQIRAFLALVDELLTR